MSKNTTMKISKKTLKKLHKLAGKMAAEKGRRVTLEEALLQLLEENEKIKSNLNESKKKEDRKIFLNLLEQKFSGGEPEDYKEYDYEDITGD
ncbi:MAG: hypothetical protein EU521_00095 [Promethearchaeota archaeon]|nr:MAG: hypothetical protein EU521_00095 [Candidatus Lokiarchaeota archaeon]